MKIIDKVHENPKLLKKPDFILAEYFAIPESMQRLVPLEDLLKFVSSIKRWEINDIYNAKTPSEKIKRLYQLYSQKVY